MTEGRRVLASGLASLAGAFVGAAGGGFAGGLLWLSVTGPHEGLEALGALVAGLLTGAILSYPGALAGVWLVVRGQPQAKRTVGYLALAYPVVSTALFFSILGLINAQVFLPVQSLVILAGVGVGAGARALALRCHAPNVPAR